MSDVMETMRLQVADHLEELRLCFKKSARKRYKLTFIARDETNGESDVLITEDSIDGIAALLERSRAREEIKA